MRQLVHRGEQSLADRWTTFGQAAAHTTRHERVCFASHARGLGLVGARGPGLAAPGGGLELKLQIDAHTAAFDVDGLDYFGDAVVLTVGGDYRIRRRLAIRRRRQRRHRRGRLARRRVRASGCVAAW